MKLFSVLLIENKVKPDNLIGVGLLEFVDEPQGHLRGGFDQVVVDGLLHVPVGKFPWDDALQDFRVAVRLPIRSRSVAKYALSAAAAAGGRRLVRITQAAK